MYILKVKNSENDNVITILFLHEQTVIDRVKDQYQTMITRFKKNKRNYLRFESIWNSDYKSLEEYFEAFVSHKETSFRVSIKYLISSELNQELHDENIPREEMISWEISSELRTSNPEVLKLMIDPRYKFECNIPKVNLSNLDIWEAAFIWYDDLGVEYNLCTEEENDSSAVYKMTADKSDGFETDYNQFVHYEIDPDNPYWQEDLEIAMCEAFIQLHHLGFCIEKRDVEGLFKKIIGMRFASRAKVKEWMFDQLNLKYSQLPAFALMESEINEEIENGITNVDFSMNGTFGENLFGFDYANFTIEYLKDNDGLMYITNVCWN